MAEKGGWRSPPPRRKVRRAPKRRVRRVPRTVLSAPQSQAPRPGENKRIERFKRSRPYYQAMRTAARNTQKVQKRREHTRQTAKRYGPRSKQARRTYGALAQQLRAEMRHGPDDVSKAAYKHYAKKLWPKVAKFYGLSARDPMPKLNFSPADRRRVYATALRGKPTITVDPEVHRQFMNKGPPKPTKRSHPNYRRYYKRTQAERDRRRVAPKSVLLHEWAHTRQRGGRSKAEIEGGAADFEHLLSKYLWDVEPKSTREYNRYRKQTRRKKGLRYTARDQFKGRRF